MNFEYFIYVIGAFTFSGCMGYIFNLLIDWVNRPRGKRKKKEGKERDNEET